MLIWLASATPWTGVQPNCPAACVSGRLSRWQRVERMIEYMLDTGEVWFATLEQIARHVALQTDTGGYAPRIDTLPYSQGVQVPDALLGKA